MKLGKNVYEYIYIYMCVCVCVCVCVFVCACVCFEIILEKKLLQKNIRLSPEYSQDHSE